MPPELAALFADLSHDRFRLVRPSKFVFLCGGTINGGSQSKPDSLRDYLLRVRRLDSRMEIVRAESATQLYRDTEYDDLITFEEDIARIASVVLVISESAGSLAELGAFATNNTIRESLRVIIQSEFENAESFIRYGPIERLKNENRERVGFYPWRVHSNGKLVARSARPHYADMVRFVEKHLDDAPSTTGWSGNIESRSFFLIYWVIYLSLAISPTLLYECVNALLPGIDVKDIRNRLFCMKLAGWIQRTAYSGRDYWYTLHDVDSIEYAFNQGVTDKDSGRRKMTVTAAFRRADAVPRHILQLASEARRPRPQ